MSDKRNFGFFSPQPYMDKAIKGMQGNCTIHTVNAKTWEDAEIAEIKAFCQGNNTGAVAG